MARIKIDKDKCKDCMLCVEVCPKGLIARSKKLNRCGIHYVEFGKPSSLKGGSSLDAKCTGCSMCAIICPDVCITVWR